MISWKVLVDEVEWFHKDNSFNMERLQALPIADIPDLDSLIAWSRGKELGIMWEGDWAGPSAMALKGL